MADEALAEPEAPFDAEASLQFLRSHGVEVETVEDRERKKTAGATVAEGEGIPFTYVCIPAESAASVTTHAGDYVIGGGDALPSILAPRFADDEGSLDEDVVARETAGALKGMFVGAGQGQSLASPSVDAIKRVARGGACEAWPLARPNAANDEKGVMLYIDEIGALRSRPRNPRAEALAASCGLHGVSIHGDVYVGRLARAPTGGPRNVDFGLSELAPDSSWVSAARRTHVEQAAAQSADGEGQLASGDGGEGEGAYSWSQGDDDVEVRVHTLPNADGGSLKKRIKVSYGKGEALRVTVDGTTVLDLPKLFDRVHPDECTWSLDDGALVVLIEKAAPRPWASLTLPGLSL